MWRQYSPISIACIPASCGLGAPKGKKRRCDHQGGGNCSYPHLITPFGYSGFEQMPVARPQNTQGKPRKGLQIHRQCHGLAPGRVHRRAVVPVVGGAGQPLGSGARLAPIGWLGGHTWIGFCAFPDAPDGQRHLRSVRLVHALRR